MSPEEDDGWESAICGGLGVEGPQEIGEASPLEDQSSGYASTEKPGKPGSRGEKICPRAGFPVRSPHTCGNLAFHAPSQRTPSGSAKSPAYPPQSVAWPGLTIRPPPAAASARSASTSSMERTLWASANPGKPLPSAGTPASPARSPPGGRRDHGFPLSEEPTAP